MVVRYRFVLALVGVIAAAISFPLARQVDFDRSIRAMFAADDPTLIGYRELEDSFGGNEVVMLVYEDAEFETTAGLERNEALSNQIANLPGVAGVLSPAVLNRAVEKLRPGSLFSKSVALFKSSDPVAKGFMNLFSGYTHSADRKRAAVVAMLERDHTRQTIDSLKSIAAELDDQPDDAIGDVALVGEPVLVHDGFELIQRDGKRLEITTIVLLSIVLLIALGDMRLVTLAAISIAWSVTITKAIMFTAGIELSLVATILTAIVTVITVTAILHLGVRFQTSIRRGKSRPAALAKTFARLSVPIFWTCMTDAAGFAALAVSGILPVAQFGIMTAIASIAVFVSLALFAPTLLMIPNIGKPAANPIVTRVNHFLHRTGLVVASWSVHHRTAVIGVTIVCVIFVVLGMGRAEVETSFLNNFRPDSEIVIDYGHVESNFGGAGVWDIVMDTPKDLSEEYLESVRRLEDDLRGIEIDGAKLTKVISLADADSVAMKVRILKLVSPSTRLSGMSATMPVFFAALLSDSADGEPGKLRIMLRSEEHLDAERKTALIDEVRRVVASSEVGKAARVTGYYVMMARLVGQMIVDQWRCFAASGVLVWGLLIVATRSLRLATLALLPNLLPVFLVLAVVGLTGGKINMGAAMIAAVSIGLSIDGSVHFLSAFQRLRRRGHSSIDSAIHAAGNIGAAVVLATIALVVGFGAMTTSQFVPTATFGNLIAATLAIGTIVNLTLLPCLVGAGHVAEIASPLDQSAHA
ncbi:MMPL family protein [Rubripirellula reticaptiva]|uniref:MMPL family protein n=2 Tax=Rubripirellula reticaptiva TaxID=2528013 RepID=A0A5C6EG47_9BACT|nr:MMPL family protein [Rubripirellula reticaptiva]